ncbi:MAG: rRNA maturation RNase YbeY [Pseudomonadota bacterium]
MPVDTIIEEERWQQLDLCGLSARAFEAVMSEMDLSPEAFDVTVLGCDDDRISILNRDFRGKHQPTNVLSWPGSERAAEEPGAAPRRPDPAIDAELGDIAIAFQTSTKEACAQKKKARDHVMHLLVHGMLHLLGYDHIRDEDAALMEKIEIKILGKMGISDPY